MRRQFHGNGQWIQSTLMSFARALSQACGWGVLGLALTATAADGTAGQAVVDAPPRQDPTALSMEELTRIEIPVVSGASRYEQRSTEAPSFVSVVTAEEVRRYGYRTLADVLRSVVGLYVSDNRTYSLLGMRGFNRGDYNSRVLLLVDGHRMNNSLSDSAYLGTEFVLDVDLIERVEIIRGPGSALYGNNAFFGVINVMTKPGEAFRHAELSGAAGSFDTFQGRVTYGNRFTNGAELLLSGTLYDSAGPESHRVDDATVGSFFGRVSMGGLSVEGAFHSREKGVPFPPYFATVAGDPHNRVEDERSYVALRFVREFPEVVEVAAQVYYDRHDFGERRVYEFDPTTPLVVARTAEWWGADLQLKKTLFERHTFILGAEYRDDFRQQIEAHWSDLPPSPPREGTAQSHGVFFQGDIGVLTNLHLVGGLRYDQYEDQDATVNPRLALVVNPFERATFKAIYGTAFRAPNFFENTYRGSSRGLTPETITTYELVYEQGLGPHLRTSLAVFYNEFDDLITWAPDPRGGSSYQNVNRAEAYGVETELEARLRWGLAGRIGYSYQYARDRETSEWLADSPKHLGHLHLNAPLWRDKLVAGVEFQYTSDRKTLQGGTADGFGLVNFTLFSQRLVKGLEVSASVYNLLDEDYLDPAPPFFAQDLIPQQGRSFRLKLTYRF